MFTTTNDRDFLCGILFALLLSISSTANAKLIGAFVVPHGGIALDPRYFPTTNDTLRQEAWQIYKSRLNISKLISTQLKPDVIFLSTPHSLADDINFLVALFPSGQGQIAPDYTTCPPVCYNKTLTIDTDLSRSLVDFLHDEGQHNVSGLSGWGGTLPFPLQWGEIIPMNDISNSTSIVLWMHPARRFNASTAMIPELLNVGADIATFFEQLPQRVVAIISGDLAHTHDADGPYGYSDAAQPFDDAIGDWIQNPDNEQALLVTASSLVDKALSCGFTGFVMLQAMFKQVTQLSFGGNGRISQVWNSTLLCNYHPTYFGMGVGQFLRI